MRHTLRLGLVHDTTNNRDTRIYNGTDDAFKGMRARYVDMPSDSVARENYCLLFVTMPQQKHDILRTIQTSFVCQ